MKIEEIAVEQLIPYEKNAKKHDEAQIRNVALSIERYGFVQPVVVDDENVIVIGHCRTEAAKLLGLPSVPCVRVGDLTPEQVAALRIIDNKTNESAWDFDLLAAEMDTIDLSGFDLDFYLPSSFEDIDSFFEEQPSEPKEKEPKKIKCPHCGEWFEP